MPSLTARRSSRCLNEWRRLGAAATTTPKYIMRKMVGESSAQYTPEEVKCGVALGMLEVADRVKPVEDIDIGRTRWACEGLEETQRFRKVLGDIAVRGDLYAKGSWDPTMLRRIEHDADIDAVCCCPSTGTSPPTLPPYALLKDLCRDLFFCAQRVGHGLD